MIYWLIIVTVLKFFLNGMDFGHSKKDNCIFFATIFLVMPPMIWAIVKLWGV